MTASVRPCRIARISEDTRTPEWRWAGRQPYLNTADLWRRPMDKSHPGDHRRFHTSVAIGCVYFHWVDTLQVCGVWDQWVRKPLAHPPSRASASRLMPATQHAIRCKSGVNRRHARPSRDLRQRRSDERRPHPRRALLSATGKMLTAPGGGISPSKSQEMKLT